jgi:hypothetical protein
MATKVDAAAAKQRQQKIILIVGAVLLVGLMAIQGPKLLHRGSSSSSSSSAAPATSESSTETPAGTSTPAATGTPSTTSTAPGVAVATLKGGPSAQVAGVVVKTAAPPAAGAGQLWSLSRFKSKDPFVQQVQDHTGTGTGASASAGGATTTASKGGGTTTASGSGVVTPSTSTPVAYAYATLVVNGQTQQLTLKDVFPKAQPTFILRAVDKKFVKIGVAGGKFTGGQAVKLGLGEKVTLMNTATGQRFVMKLVYTGDKPEQIAGFKAPASSATAPASTQTTTATSGATTATPGAPAGTP